MKYVYLDIERIIESGVRGRDGVLLEDYLKVVEEKERIENKLNSLKECKENTLARFRPVEEWRKENEKHVKELREKKNDLKTLGKICNEQRIELKEKDEVIDKLKIELIESDQNCIELSEWIDKLKLKDKEKEEEIESLKDYQTYHMISKERHNEILIGRDEKINELKVLVKRANDRVDSYEDWYNNNLVEFNIMKERVKLLEEKEDTWTLSYSYKDKEGNIKNYKQSGLLKEEYEEMYGMDSDNWLSHSLVKDRKEVK